MELYELSLSAVRDLIKNGEVTAEQAVSACISRIRKTEPSIMALLDTRLEEAQELARNMDISRPSDLSLKPLWGVPVTVKDALTTKDMETTAGSKILKGFIPPYDAFAVEQLRNAGAIILGKNNMDEFAMGSTTENSAYHPTANPWDRTCVPGGSSGGSAASVAACQCFASLGSDTGGSVRQPASLCGCVGLKPTYGRVSRYGLLAYGSSLDQIGTLTRTVEDAAIMLQVIAGHDDKDSTSSPCDVPDYAAFLQAHDDLSGLVIGVPKEFFEHSGMDESVADICGNAVKAVQSLGATIRYVTLPHTEYSIPSYYIIASAEASSNLARYDGVRYGHRTDNPEDLYEMYAHTRAEGFGQEVQRRILLGSYVLSAGYYDAYYRKAAQLRRLIRQDFLAALCDCDLLLAPVSPVTAWKLGSLAGDPLQMYFMDIFTLSLNLAGLPGLSVPVGMLNGKPVGVQLTGRSFDEGTLLFAGSKLTKLLGTDGIHPNL